jgi:adenine-specific DNA-methyltransferase
MAKPKTTPATDPTRVADLMPTTPDGQADRLAELKRLFPDLFTNEGRLDPGELKRLIEPDATNETERYEFKWYGKAASKREAFTPTTATLVYDEARSVNPEKADGNLIIEGENLEVLKLLLNAYREKVKCIYIDPPYNTGKDFIYKDNYAKDRRRYWEETGETLEGVKLETNLDTSGRHHSDWLSMMQSRLLVARSILMDSGFIVVSIDDAEFANLDRLLREVFGVENHMATLVYDKNRKNDAKFFSVGHEYMLVFAKDKQVLSENNVILRAEKEGVKEVEEVFNSLRGKFGDDFDRIQSELKLHYAAWTKDDPRQPLTRFTKVDEFGPYRDDRDLSWPGGGGPRYEVLHPKTKKPCKIPSRGWVFSNAEKMREEIDAGRIIFGPDEKTVPTRRTNLFDQTTQVMRSVSFSYAQSAAQEFARIFDGERVFENPKPVTDLRKLIEYLTGPDEVIIDFFAGSGSTAHAILESNKSNSVNRKFILVQIPEATPPDSPARRAGFPTISSLTIERVKRVIEGYGPEPQPIPDAGFKVYRLQKSNFPRCEFRPDPDLSETENVEALRHYIDEKEAAHLAFLDGAAERAVFDEVLLKNGFRLDWTRERRDDFPNNTVYCVSDGEREALVCLAWSERLHESTLKRLRELSESGDAPFFICLERSLDTTAKWNLKHLLGKHLVAF